MASNTSANSRAKAELSAIDAIAVFEFTDQPIQDYGSTIDGLAPDLSGEFIQALREVGNRLNEPDLQPTAFDDPPSWSYPESQERFSKLRSSQDLPHYLTGTGRLPDTQEQLQQLRDKKALSEYFNLSQSEISTQSQPAPSLLQPPSGRQPQRQQSPVSSRRSRSPQLPARMRGYDLNQDEGPMKRKAPAGNILTLSSSGSEEEDLPSGEALRKRARVSASPSKARSTGQATSTSASTSAKRKGKGRAQPSRPLVTTATREERELLNRAKRTPPPDTERRAPTRGSSNRTTHAGMRSSSSLAASPSENQNSTPQVIGDGEEVPSILEIMSREVDRRSVGEASAATSRKEAATSTPTRTESDAARSAKAVQAAPSTPAETLSLAAQEAKLAAHVYEDDISISTAAKASAFGWTVAEGYEGFKYVSSFRKDGIIKEHWRCLKCGELKMASGQGKPTNLKSHIKICKGPKNDAAAALVRADETTAGGNKSSAMAGSSTLAASSYRGASVSGWLNAQQALDIELTRRLALVNVLLDARPFTSQSSPSQKAVIRSIDHRATTSFKSASTIRRDLRAFHGQLQSDLKTELQGIDTLMSIQHDGWTNKGFQHSFIAIIGSYVNAQWEYQERLLSFDVVKDKHSGATFAGHLVRTINALQLDDSWYGAVTSDSAGTNTRMLTLLEENLAEADMQDRTPWVHKDDPQVQKMLRKSCSSFPKASLRHSGSWTVNDYRILCLNHHINLAVRDGFAKFGVKVKTKTQRKVLEIQPKPAILVTDENGEPVEVSEEEDSEDEDEPADDDDQPEDGNVDEAAVDDVDDEEPPEDDDSDMGPDDEDIGSDDDGGPEANGATPAESSATGASSALESTVGNNLNSVAKLEAFTTWIHRSSQRKADFRKRMAKEYHLDESGLANAPFPSKPNKTRWNSHFSMIRGALKIREAIDAHCRAYIGVRNEVLGNYLLTDSQ
ncbi:hypothetical protein CF319_g8287 [Tilletia indica]|nr:hypothetical protein CF319_g8287 [Tilletia indica]